MLTSILAGLVAAANPSPALVHLAQADQPKTRRVCKDIPAAYSRTMRRVCTTVAVKQPDAAPAPPPPPPVTELGVGMPVVDTAGGSVGTIVGLAGDTVTVKTDKHQAQLPRTSLTISDGKALFGLTQAQLNASIDQSLAAATAAALKVGAAVTGTGGTSVGTIDALTADNVTVKLASGLKISVPRSGITAGADGTAMIGISAAELEAQVKAANPGR